MLSRHYHEALGIQSLRESWPVPRHIDEGARTISHGMHRRDLAPGMRHAFLVHAVAGDEIVRERDGIACLDTCCYGGWAQHIGGNIARPLQGVNHVRMSYGIKGRGRDLANRPRRLLTNQVTGSPVVSAS